MPSGSWTRREFLQGASGACLVGAAAAPGVTSSGSAEAAAPFDLTGYVQTFREDFNDLDVSAWGPGTRWIAHTPWNGDFGDAVFVDPAPGFPFTTQDGVLRIEARKGADGKWRSGLLASVDQKGAGFSQQYGYFEMSAKFPAGEGVWPAFWLIGRTEQNTAEIDVVEHYGAFPERYTASVHVWDRKDPSLSKSKHSRIPVTKGLLSSGFHTYGVSVEEDFIGFYFNRREVWRTETPREHRRPLYLLVDLGLGGGWPIENAPNPSFMYVDYVHAWRKDS